MAGQGNNAQTEIEDMQWRDYRAMLQTRHQAATMLGMTGMEPWPPDKAARLMAIVTVWGNNEGFTLSPKFKVDREYIQEVYHIGGGEVPDNEQFNDCLRHYIERMEQIEQCKDSTITKENPFFKECADWIKQMYNFVLYC